MTGTRVAGSRRRFHAEAGTDHPDEVWRLWTTPSTWGDWDRGLQRATVEGPFVVGARGTVTDRTGRTSPFRVTTLAAGRAYAYVVPLPAARLVLERTVLPAAGARRWRVRHEVSFLGPAAAVWAVLLGRGFRRQLGPTVDALVTCAAAVGAPPSSDSSREGPDLP